MRPILCRQARQPWRPIDWRPAQMIGANRQIGEWALDTFKKLQLTRAQAQRLAGHFLWDEQRSFTQLEPRWIRRLPNRAFSIVGWSDDRAEQQTLRVYASRVLDVLLPAATWTWRKRWKEIGKDMPMAISMGSKKSDQARISACQGAMIAALLHEAPEDIQMMLSALKRGRHPDEPNGGNPDTQYIRCHFFAEKPPTEPISVEAKFLLDLLIQDPNAPPENYSLDDLDI